MSKLRADIMDVVEGAMKKGTSVSDVIRDLELVKLTVFTEFYRDDSE